MATIETAEHKDTSSLEDLGAAWDAVEATEDNPPGITDEEIENERIQSAESRGDTGEPAEPEPGAAEPPEPNEPVVPPAEAASPKESPPAEADERCPVGLSATAREAWKDTPAPMKKEIAKRERDFSMGMQRNAEAAQRAGQMDQAMKPFAQYFAMNRQSPEQGVLTVLQTAATLQMGSPQQRAQVVHDMIHQFGVDINALDALLTGEAAPPAGAPVTSPVTPDIQRMIDNAVAPYKQHMDNTAAQGRAYQQQQATEAQQDLQTFAGDGKHEFYKDVRGVMADLLDMASGRGQVMSLQVAYDNACRLDPQIDKIVQSRITAANLAKKRGAAVSTHGNMGGPGPASGTTGNLNDDLNAAWDAIESPGQI